MYCTNCGEKNQEKAKFCHKCGTAISSGQPRHTNTVPATSHITNNATKDVANTEPKKRSKLTRNFRIVGVILLFGSPVLIVLIVSAAGGTTWFSEDHTGLFGEMFGTLASIGVLYYFFLRILRRSRLTLGKKIIIATITALIVRFVLPSSLGGLLTIIAVPILLVLWIYDIIQGKRRNNVR